MSLFEEWWYSIRKLSDQILKGKVPQVTVTIEERNEVEGTYYVVKWQPPLPIFVDGETVEEAKTNARLELKGLLGSLHGIRLHFVEISSRYWAFLGHFERDEWEN